MKEKNTTEKFRCQNEMASRACDLLPFVDKKLITQVTAAIMAEARRIKSRCGEVLYPFTISPREKMAILGRLDHPLRERVFFIPGIRMEDGVGTLIQIDGRGR